MRAYARKFGEDEDKWGVTGLIHDFDYERWPSLEDHPFRGNEILTQLVGQNRRQALIHQRIWDRRRALLDLPIFATERLVVAVVLVAIQLIDRGV